MQKRPLFSLENKYFQAEIKNSRAAFFGDRQNRKLRMDGGGFDDIAAPQMVCSFDLFRVFFVLFRGYFLIQEPEPLNNTKIHEN